MLPKSESLIKNYTYINNFKSKELVEQKRCTFFRWHKFWGTQKCAEIIQDMFPRLMPSWPCNLQGRKVSQFEHERLEYDRNDRSHPVYPYTSSPWFTPSTYGNRKPIKELSPWAKRRISEKKLLPRSTDIPAKDVFRRKPMTTKKVEPRASHGNSRPDGTDNA